MRGNVCSTAQEHTQGKACSLSAHTTSLGRACVLPWQPLDSWPAPKEQRPRGPAPAGPPCGAEVLGPVFCRLRRGQRRKPYVPPPPHAGKAIYLLKSYGGVSAKATRPSSETSGPGWGLGVTVALGGSEAAAVCSTPGHLWWPTGLHRAGDGAGNAPAGGRSDPYTRGRRVPGRRPGNGQASKCRSWRDTGRTWLTSTPDTPQGTTARRPCGASTTLPSALSDRADR